MTADRQPRRGHHSGFWTLAAVLLGCLLLPAGPGVLAQEKQDDPAEKDKWGIPVLRFHISFGDNEKKMVVDMADQAQEMFEHAGFEIVGVDREPLLEGYSIHELGTARMGTNAKTSVLNQFQQSHDVKNLFVVDGSSHVSASCQNPTWTILALAWRSSEYLADELKKGNL